MEQSLAELILICMDTATCPSIRVLRVHGQREGVPQESREGYRALASHCGCVEVDELVDVQEHDIVIAVPAAHEALMVHQHLHQEMQSRMNSQLASRSRHAFMQRHHSHSLHFPD